MPQPKPTVADDQRVVWAASARRCLKGRTIVNVRYLTDEERTMLGWHRAAIAIELDSGHTLWPSADDEGNDAGAMFTTFGDLATIPGI